MNQRARDIRIKKLSASFPVGHVMHALTVTGEAEHRHVGTKSARHWFIPVQCVCGTAFAVSVSHARQGDHTTSCGCMRKKRCGDLNRSHGFTTDPLMRRVYALYQGIIGHCKTGRYARAGIKVCDEWALDKTAFLRWCVDSGWMPGLAIDRKDNDGDYSPVNCHFVDDLVNANNRSSNRVLTVDGVTATFADHCRQRKLNPKTIDSRLSAYGWSIERAFSETAGTVQVGSFVYLGYCSSSRSLTVGRTSSIWTRNLHRFGFRLIGVYEVSSSAQAGCVEFLVHQRLIASGIPMGGQGKTQRSPTSREVFSARVAAGKFRFRKACEVALTEIPALVARINSWKTAT